MGADEVRSEPDREPGFQREVRRWHFAGVTITTATVRPGPGTELFIEAIEVTTPNRALRCDVRVGMDAEALRRVLGTPDPPEATECPAEAIGFFLGSQEATGEGSGIAALCAFATPAGRIERILWKPLSQC